MAASRRDTKAASRKAFHSAFFAFLRPASEMRFTNLRRRHFRKISRLGMVRRRLDLGVAQQLAGVHAGDTRRIEFLPPAVPVRTL
jgi:hypothetical protein